MTAEVKWERFKGWVTGMNNPNIYYEWELRETTLNTNRGFYSPQNRTYTFVKAGGGYIFPSEASEVPEGLTDEEAMKWVETMWRLQG